MSLLSLLLTIQDRLRKLPRGSCNIPKAITDAFAEWDSSTIKSLLVEIMLDMHDIGFLRIYEIHVENRAWDLRKRNIHYQVEILAVLVLVDQHLILFLQFQKEPELRHE